VIWRNDGSNHWKRYCASPARYFVIFRFHRITTTIGASGEKAVGKAVKKMKVEPNFEEQYLIK